MAPKIVCIDGNIGAGKSTLLDTLKEQGYTIFSEDLVDWIHLLDLSYKDPHRWMCTLQVKILTNMKRQYDTIQTLKSDLVFIERCPEASMVFVNVGLINGYLTPEEVNVIQSVYNHVHWKPDVRFYIQPPLEVCMQRIHERQRSCEEGLSMDYLQQLDTLYHQSKSSSTISIVTTGQETPQSICTMIKNHL